MKLPSSLRTTPPLLLLFGITLLVTFTRLWVLSLGEIGLFADESQYWLWAQKPDWGYYSKPPMVAWAIAFSTSICSADTSFCVKWTSPLAYGLTSLMVYGLGRHLFDTKTGFWAGLLFLTLPGVSLSSGIISTDPFLLLFWAASMLALLKAIRSDALGWWIATGLLAGLGLMSKYNFAFFLPAVLLFSAWERDRFNLLFNPKLYMAGGLALVVFLPNIFWNASNDWASFVHTSAISQIDQAGVSHFNPDQMAEFIGANLGLMGPVLGVVFVLMAWRARHLVAGEQGQGYRYLFSFLLPLAVVILTISLLTRAHGNWAAPIHISSVLLATAYAISKGWRGVLITALCVHLVAATLMMRFDATANFLGIELSERIDPFNRVRGWEEAGRQLSEIRAQHPHAGLLTDRRKISAQMVYYTTPHAFDLVQWNYHEGVHDHFELTTTMRDKKGKDFLVVTPAPVPEHILSRFESWENVGSLYAPLYGTDALILDVYLAKNFLGQ